MREIILGPPGTGKTTHLLGIVREELARGTAPERIAFVTFTRRAAEEAITRAGSQLGLDADRLPLFRTLHSLAFRELGLSSAEVFQDARVREFAEWSGIEISPRAYLSRGEREGAPALHRPADRAMHMENLARVRCVPLRAQYDADDDDLAWDEVDHLARSMESFKRRHGLLDFTDMLSRFTQEKKMPAIDVLIVDECFTGDTPVLVGLDGSWLNIKTIVETAYTGPVISWSEGRGTVVGRVSGHRKILRNKPMKQIKFFVKKRPREYSYGTSILVCTEDHRVRTTDGWIAAKLLTSGQTVFVETAQVRVKPYQHKHKITPVGKQSLSESLRGNKRGFGKSVEGKREAFLVVKGGNGRGLSDGEQLFLDKISCVNMSVTAHAIITTGYGRSGTYPPHYKVDFLVDERMLVVEIDGDSHRDPIRKELDIKKTKLLNSLGYDVVRFTNKEVATLTPQELQFRLQPNCLLEAEILSVVDYETMETYVYDIEVENTHCYFAHGLLVHNCQDLSPLQWQMVDLLSTGARRVVVAGDDDQAIYRWAGADVEHLVQMDGRARVLEQSWRVPGAVQRLADSIIAPVTSRRPKRWRPRPEEGAVTSTGSLEDPSAWAGEWRDGVQPVLCLARNTYVLEEHVAPALQRVGVLYEWPAQPPVPPATLAAVHAWERLRAGAGASAEAVRGVYRLLGAGDLARGHRELPGVPDDHQMTLEELVAGHGLLTRAPWYEALVRRMGVDTVNYLRAARARGERLNERPRVRLSTIHSAKGGEARRVVLMTEMAARTWREMDENEDDERRVWYVAATRAREELVVVHGDRVEACPWL